MPQGQYIRCLQFKMSIFKKYDNMMIMNALVSDPSGGNGHGPDSEAILANHCIVEDPNCSEETSITMDPLNTPSSSSRGASEYMYYDPVTGQNQFYVIAPGRDWKFKIGYKKHCRTFDKDTQEETWTTTEEDLEITFPKARPNGTYPITGNNPHGRYPDPVEGEAGRRTTGSGHYITYLSEKVCFVEECEDCKIEIKTDKFPSGWANEGTNNMNPGGIDRCQTLSQCMAWGADGKHTGRLEGDESYDDWWEEYSDANNGNPYHGNGELQDNLLNNLAEGQVPTPVGAFGSRPEGFWGNCFRPLPNPGGAIGGGAGHHIGLNPNGGFNNMDVVLEVIKHVPGDPPCDHDPDDHDINYHPMIPWQEVVWPLPIPGGGLVVPLGGLPEGTVVFIVEGGDPDHKSHPDDCGTIEYWVTEAAIAAGTTIPHPDDWTDDEFEGLKELCLHDGSHTDLDCNKIRRCLHPNECPPDCLYCLGDCIRISGLPGEWTLIDLQYCDTAPVQPRGEDWEEERKKEKEEVLEVADNLTEAGELAIPHMPGWEWNIDADGKWDILFNDARVLGQTVYWWDTRLTGIGWVADWNKGTIEGFGFDKPITYDANREEGPTNLLVKIDEGDISKSLQLWDYENKEVLGWSMSRGWSLEGLPGSLPEVIGPTTRPRTIDEAAAWFADHTENKYADAIKDYHQPSSGADASIAEYWLSMDEEEAMPGGHWPRTPYDSPFNKLSSSQQSKGVKKLFKIFRKQLMAGASMDLFTEKLFTLWMMDPWMTEALLLYAKDWLQSARGDDVAGGGVLSAKLWGLLAQIYVGVGGAEYTFPGVKLGPYATPRLVVDSPADIKELFTALITIIDILASAAPLYKKLWINRRRGSLDSDLGALGITGPKGVEYPETEAGLPECNLSKITEHIKDNISTKGGVFLGDVHGQHAIPRYIADNVASWGIDVLFLEMVKSPRQGGHGPGSVHVDEQAVLDAYMAYSGDPWDTTEHHNLREAMFGWTHGNGCTQYNAQTPLAAGEPGYANEAAMENWAEVHGYHLTNSYDEYINIIKACKDAGIAVVGIDTPRDGITGLFAADNYISGQPLDPETGNPYAADYGYFDTENYPNHPEYSVFFGKFYEESSVHPHPWEEHDISNTYMTSNQHWANVINNYIFNNPKEDGSDPKFIVYGGGAHSNGVVDVVDEMGDPLVKKDADTAWNKYGGVNKLIYEAGYAGQAGIKKDIKIYDFLTSACADDVDYYLGHPTQHNWKRDGSTVTSTFLTADASELHMIETGLGAFEKTPCACLSLTDGLPRSTKFHGEAAAGEEADLSKYSDYVIFINASNGPEFGLFNNHNKEVAMDCTEMDELPKPSNQPTWGPY